MEVDTGALYARKRAELCTLLRSLDAAALVRTVPATPAWRVRDVLAHVVGITADLNAGNFGRVDPDAWTAAQVASRSGRSIAEVIDEWEHESPRFEEGLRLLGYEIGSHYVADLHAHLQDVRSALGLPADRDELTVEVSLDFYLHSFEEALHEASAGAVDVEIGSESHHLGDGPVQARLRADPFELLRALSGRRTAAQVAAFEWQGDVERIVPLVSRYGFPEHDVGE